MRFDHKRLKSYSWHWCLCHWHSSCLLSVTLWRHADVIRRTSGSLGGKRFRESLCVFCRPWNTSYVQPELDSCKSRKHGGFNPVDPCVLDTPQQFSVCQAPVKQCTLIPQHTTHPFFWCLILRHLVCLNTAHCGVLNYQEVLMWYLCSHWLCKQRLEATARTPVLANANPNWEECPGLTRHNPVCDGSPHHKDDEPEVCCGHEQDGNICLSVSLRVCLRMSVFLSVSLCVCVCVWLFVSVCLSVHPSVHLSVCLSLCCLRHRERQGLWTCW